MLRLLQFGLCSQQPAQSASWKLPDALLLMLLEFPDCEKSHKRLTHQPLKSQCAAVCFSHHKMENKFADSDIKNSTSDTVGLRWTSEQGEVPPPLSVKPSLCPKGESLWSPKCTLAEVFPGLLRRVSCSGAANQHDSKMNRVYLVPLE